MGKGAMEREINLVDMIWAVCLKWRSILACAVILAVLAGGFSYYKSMKSVSALKETESLTQQEHLESLEKGLTYEEMKNSEVYFNYKKTYDELKCYNENAPLMQMDANNFYVGEISYYIDNGYKIEYPVMDESNNIVAMVNAYQAEIGTEEFARQVQQIIGSEDDASYAMELVDCEGLYAGKNIIENQADRGVLAVAVYAKDKETCIALKELVKETVDAAKTEVIKRFGAHEVSTIKDIVRQSASGKLLDDQKAKMDLAYTCSNNMYNISLKFTPAQQTYVDAYLAQAEDAEDDAEAGEKESVPTATISKKFVVLGFLAGAFLMFMIWGVIYIFSNRLRMEDDFETIFGSRLLGNVPVFEKKKKWFGFIDCIFEKLRHYNKRCFGKEEALDMVAANVRIFASKAEVKKVMVTGAVFGETEKKLAKELEEKLKNNGIEIICASPVLYNAESLEKLVDIGAVVLIELAGKTLYDEVVKEIEICKQQEVDLIGCVVAY